MHECPDCYTACRCHGDIDDMLLGAVGGCTHCSDDYLTYGPDDEPSPMDEEAGCLE